MLELPSYFSLEKKLALALSNLLFTMLIRRLNKLIPPQNGGPVADVLIATFNKNIQDLGYTLSPGVIASLRQKGNQEAFKFFSETFTCLKELRGVKNYQPMYPNFPQQVMDASDTELYLNAFFHYFSVWVSDLSGENLIWLPKYRKNHREPLKEQVRLTVLNLGSEEDLFKLATRLATSNTSLSETDKEDLKTLINGGYLEIPLKIPNKENLAVIGALSFGSGLMTLFETATDVLRLATALSKGDVSLAEDTTFRQFKREERKILLGLLSKAENLEEDMKRYPEKWKRLGETLHPGDYKKRYPLVFKAFTKIRNNFHIQTYHSTLEKRIRNENLMEAAELLTMRPGEFARRLDHLLRLSEHATGTKHHILNSFWKVAGEVSTPVLLQVMTHFKNRNDGNMRVIFPKGKIAKVQAVPARPGLINLINCEQIQEICADVLRKRFAILPLLGKVYVDPELKEYLVPFSQRSASKSLRTLVRGSKIRFSDQSDTLRFFIYWTNGKNGERVDLDLSAAMYDSEFRLIGQIYYGNLRTFSSVASGTQYYACHSGDITDAPQGACEFIDIDIPSFLQTSHRIPIGNNKYAEEASRYVVMSVNSYTQQLFSDLPTCFAGWMVRKEPKSGEIFEPKTVVDRVDVTSATKAVIPLIIDIRERKVIWADASMSINQRYVNNVVGNSSQLALVGRAFTKINKPNLYDLFYLHAHARGTVVKSREDAEIIFDSKDAFELDKIASEYMVNTKP
jgi:hypothetical protein